MEILMSHEWLERIERKIDAQGRVLDLHTDMLQEHGRRLDKHEVLLDGLDKEVRRNSVMLEELKSDVQGVAEGVVAVNERVDRGLEAARTLFEDRTVPLELAGRDHSSRLAGLEQRLPKRGGQKRK